MKVCTKCHIPKELSEYYTTGKKDKSLRGDCKKCFNESHREQWKINTKKYYMNHKYGRNKTIKALGHTQEFLSQKITEQNGECKICGRKEKLVVDHCHLTNKFRGLLCHKCNLGIGHLNDSPVLLERALEYLTFS